MPYTHKPTKVVVSPPPASNDDLRLYVSRELSKLAAGINKLVLAVNEIQQEHPKL